MQTVFGQKKLIVGMLLLIVAFFFLRLIALTQLPIFTDEAIYLRWAQIAKNDANWRFISLTDGKQPLFIWFTMVSMKFFSDPVVAGRIVSVLAGLASMIGLFFLGREVFRNAWIGLITAGLYVIYPFALVYDRMALYDGLVGTFAVWGLLFSIWLVRTLRLDVALLMGFVTGAAVLNKSNGFFTLALLPLTLILFDWKKKDRWRKLLQFAGLFFVVAAVTYGLYAILRLSPFFYIIDEKNAIFVYPLKEWIQHPFMYVIQNLRGLGDWFLTYFGVPFTLLVIASFFLNKKYLQEKVLLVLWFLLPFVYLVFFGKTLYPRYIFFMTLSLLPLVAYSLYLLFNRKQKIYFYIAAVFLIVMAGYADIQILTNFAKAPIPNPDKGQYLVDWPSGAGVNESIEFLRNEAQKEKIVIATAGTFGLMPQAYELYFVDNPNIIIKGMWPVGELPPDEIVELSRTYPTYVVFYQECIACRGKGIAPGRWPLSEVWQYKKIAPNTYLTIYKMSPR